MDKPQTFALWVVAVALAVLAGTSVINVMDGVGTDLYRRNSLRLQTALIEAGAKARRLRAAVNTLTDTRKAGE